MATSALTEFLILRVLSNEIRTFQCLVAYTLDDGLHELDISQFCLYEKSIDPVHPRASSKGESERSRRESSGR